MLDSPRLRHAFADRCRGLAGLFAREFGVSHRRYLDVDVYSIEEWSTNAFTVFLDFARTAPTLPFGITVVATFAGIRCLFAGQTLRRVRCPYGPYFTEKTGYPASPKTIGEMIRKRRLDLGLRQKDVAEIIGCDTMTVVNWEKSHTTSPQIKHMAGVVKFLGFNPLPDDDTVAQRLANHRKVRGLTQKVFAAQLGVDQGTLAKWERGERKPAGLFLSAVVAAMETKESPLRSSADIAEIQVPQDSWGQRLVEYRAAERLSQRQLAARIGVDQTTVARWESGEHRPMGLWLKALVAELSWNR